MAFKMKGFSGFKTDLRKKSGFGPRATEMDPVDLNIPPRKRGHDDQSRELAISKFEMGEYKKNPALPKNGNLKKGDFTTPGIPESLYNADGKKINTNNIDEGNLSKIKVESGTNRKYVEYVEGSKAGGRLYLNKVKKDAK